MQKQLFFVSKVPITPARLQGQRWRNWAHTRLGHLPQNLVYKEEEIIQRLEEADDEVLDNKDIPMENVGNAVEDIPDDGDAVVTVAQKKTITAIIQNITELILLLYHEQWANTASPQRKSQYATGIRTNYLCTFLHVIS